jgi:hypothetical protein
MSRTINEHTKTLIDELMRSLAIQRELLCELEKMTRISSEQSDDYAEQRYIRAASRRSNV